MQYHILLLQTAARQLSSKRGAVKQLSAAKTAEEELAAASKFPGQANIETLERLVSSTQ